jgi:two-component system, LytTR family, sensor kinase
MASRNSSFKTTTTLATGTSADKKPALVFFAAFIAWFAVWSTLQFKLLQDFGVPVSKAITDAVISNLVLEGFCLLIINNMRYYLPRREKYWYTLVISISFSALWLVITRAALWALFKNDSDYIQSLSQTSFLRYSIAFLMMACCTVLSLLWFSQRNQQADNARKLDMERLAREAELNKLRQQLQPHFLFNSLNSISALTGTQPEKARHMIQQLSDFLRGTLKKEEQQWTSFEEELQYLQLYLDIEKVRFGYRLQTNIDADEETKQMLLPSMLLQPLVENAIKFGLYDTIGEVTIFINAKKVNDLLQVTVKNPFDEATSASTKGTGFGLSSIRRRLFLLFARQDLLEIKKESQQFCTIISIPQQHESNYN